MSVSCDATGVCVCVRVRVACRASVSFTLRTWGDLQRGMQALLESKDKSTALFMEIIVNKVRVYFHSPPAL